VIALLSALIWSLPLAANMWVSPSESGPDFLGLDRRLNGSDDDGNGYLDDVHGINAITRTGTPPTITATARTSRAASARSATIPSASWVSPGACS
jgi:hypothetical protein